jgi:hypothetical protein
MVTQKRSNNSVFAQESPRTIHQVALYARVSTLNSQDPESSSRNCGNMQGAAAGRSSKNLRIRVYQAARRRGQH